jgi:integrase
MSTMAKPWKHPDSGIYYHRVEVPKDIRSIINKSWIKSSLRTKNFSEAKHLFALQYAETQALFSQAREQISLTPKDIEILTQRWFVYSLSDIEDDGNSEDYLITEDAEGGPRCRSGHIAEALERGYASQHGLVKGHVKDVLKDNNILLPEGSPDYQKLTESICWRYLELTRIAEDRHYGDWEAADAKFTQRAEDKLSTESKRKPIKTARILDYKPLKDIIASFSAYKIQREDWDEKTQADAEGVYGQLIEYLDANTDPSTITREQLRDFSVLLSQLPTNYTRTPRFKNLSLHQLTEIAANEELKTIAAATVKKKFNFIKSLFKHATQEEWIDKDRATGITIAKGVAKKRIPYTPAELNSIFTETQGADRASDFWLPRIGLTTGMRSNEILQLTTADIRQTSGIWYFDINEDMDIESGQAKKTKTDNSRRSVPVPEVLIKAGFIDYVQAIGSGRLFPCVHLGTDKSYSSVFSKRFNTILDRLSLKPEADEALMRDFHSFRHTFRANTRANGVPKETADLLGGWKDQEGRTAGDDYGVHYDSFMSELKAAIDKIDYGQLKFT